MVATGLWPPTRMVAANWVSHPVHDTGSTTRGQRRGIRAQVREGADTEAALVRLLTIVPPIVSVVAVATITAAIVGGEDIEHVPCGLPGQMSDCN